MNEEYYLVTLEGDGFIGYLTDSENNAMSEFINGISKLTGKSTDSIMQEHTTGHIEQDPYAWYSLYKIKLLKFNNDEEFICSLGDVQNYHYSGPAICIESHEFQIDKWIQLAMKFDTLTINWDDHNNILSGDDNWIGDTSYGAIHKRFYNNERCINSEIWENGIDILGNYLG